MERVGSQQSGAASVPDRQDDADARDRVRKKPPAASCAELRKSCQVTDNFYCDETMFSNAL